MAETRLRQAAIVLLKCAVRIAPGDAREWGRGISEELNYVEGDWAAVMWALGGASVMGKQALISILRPGQQGVTPDDVLFEKEVSLGKVGLAVGAGSTLAALLFFTSPPFRQAFRVATRPWFSMFGIGSRDFQSRLMALALESRVASRCRWDSLLRPSIR